MPGAEARVELRGRVAVVTGASSGIGWETALAFARRGATVVGVARREERLRALSDALRAHAPGSGHLAGDLGERSFAEHAVTDTLARHGRLDVLVNNAAAPLHKLIYRTSVEEAEALLRVNFLSSLWTCFAAIPAMLRQGGGAIVHVTSFAALVAPPRESVYAASKAALHAFSEGLAMDLAGSGIHVAQVVPGAIDTEIWDKRQEQSGYAGRRHPAADVADAIVEVVEQGRREIVVPRRDPRLVLARWLRGLAPGWVRAGAARVDPVPPEALEEARARARAGRALGPPPPPAASPAP